MPKLTLVLDRKPVQVYDLDQPVIRVGRGQGMDILIDNVSVSRRQAELREEAGAWTVRDLGSSNGTFVNGQRLTTDRSLQAGDEITFGKFSLFFEKVLAERPMPQPAVATRPTASTQSDGTLHLRADEIEKLQKGAQQKRRAHLVWESAGQQGTHYLDTESAVLIGRSILCDLQVPKAPKQHVLVLRGQKGFEIRNLSGWYKMKVRGQETKRASLRNADIVEVAGLRMTFMDEVR